jgi:hypothetical protein
MRKRLLAAAALAIATVIIAIGPAGAVQRVAGSASATQRAETSPTDQEMGTSQGAGGEAGAEPGGATDRGKGGVITPPSASDGDDDTE